MDIDFLVSDPAGYRALRELLTGAQPLVLLREVRADPYGLRTVVQMDGQAIKFEVVREARIALAAPTKSDVVCGVSTLTPLDLAMMGLRLPLLRKALAGPMHAGHGHDAAQSGAVAKGSLTAKAGCPGSAQTRCQTTLAPTVAHFV